MESKWTLDSIEHHFSQVISDLKELIFQMRSDDNRAKDVALAAIDERLALLNEIKKAMLDQQNEFMRKEASELKFGAMEGRLSKIEESGLVKDSKGAGRAQVWAIILSVVAFLASVTTLIFKFLE